MADENQELPLQWSTLDFQPLIDGLDPLESVVDSFQGFIDAISTILTALTAAIEAAKLFLLDFTDVMQALYEAIVTLIQDTVQQLTQTGIYQIIHYTPSFSMYMTPTEWCQAVSDSFSDRMDAERPILIDPEAFVCAVALVTTSDNLKDLMIQWKNFCSLLGSFVSSLFSQMDDWPIPGDPFEVIPGIGKIPNWRSVKLADIFPGLNQAADYLMGLLDTLAPNIQKSALLDAFLAALNQKIAVLQMYGQKILAVLALIKAILSIEGLYSLVISGQGDASWVGRQLTSATGGPHDYGKYDSAGNLLPEDQQKQGTFTLGTMFLMTGGSTAAISLLSGFFEGVVCPLPNPDVPQIPDLP